MPVALGRRLVQTSGDDRRLGTSDAHFKLDSAFLAPNPMRGAPGPLNSDHGSREAAPRPTFCRLAACWPWGQRGTLSRAGEERGCSVKTVPSLSRSAKGVQRPASSLYDPTSRVRQEVSGSGPSSSIAVPSTSTTTRQDHGTSACAVETAQYRARRGPRAGRCDRRIAGHSVYLVIATLLGKRCGDAQRSIRSREVLPDVPRDCGSSLSRRKETRP